MSADGIAPVTADTAMGPHLAAPAPSPAPAAPGMPAPDNPVIVERNRSEIAALGAAYASNHSPALAPMFPGQTPEQDAQARALAANMDAAQAAVDALGSNPDPVTQGKAIAALNHARYLMAQFLSDTPPPPPQPDGPSMRAWTEDDQANAERVERLKAAYEYWGGALAPLGIEVPNPYAPPEGFDPSRAHDLEQEGPPPMNPY